MHVLRIRCASHYELGHAQGSGTRAHIVAWLRGAAHTRARAAVSREWARDVRAITTRAFPHLAEELRGIADGAGVSEDDVWLCNLRSEMRSDARHCTTLVRGGLLQHNEDGDPDQHGMLTLLLVSGMGGDFGGVVYPAILLGNAATWRAGVFMVQTSLHPSPPVARGLAANFVQRHALCGATSEQIVGRLCEGGLSAAFHVTVVHRSGVVSVEACGNEVSARHIVSPFVHANRFKRMRVDERMDGTSRVREEAARLGVSMHAAPLHTHRTLAHLALDCATGLLDVDGTELYIWGPPELT